MAVAVLLTHMLRSAVASMKPPTTPRGNVPEKPTTRSAMRRGSPHLSIPRASRKPPRNRNTRSFA